MNYYSEYWQLLFMSLRSLSPQSPPPPMASPAGTGQTAKYLNQRVTYDELIQILYVFELFYQT